MQSSHIEHAIGGENIAREMGYTIVGVTIFQTEWLARTSMQCYDNIWKLGEDEVPELYR